MNPSKLENVNDLINFLNNCNFTPNETTEEKLSTIRLLININPHMSFKYTELNEYKQLENFFSKNSKILKMFEHLIYDYDYIYFNTQNLIKELILTKKKLLNNISDVEIKKYYTNDVNFVKQNPDMYPILFNYENYIRKEIFEANYRKFNKTIFFSYISDLTNGFKKSSAIKKYYFDKYLDLIEIN